MSLILAGRITTIEAGKKASYHAPFGILVTQTDEAAVTDPPIVCLPLSSLMMLR